VRLDLSARQSIIKKMALEYKRAGKKQKGMILANVIELTEYNRKYAITILNGYSRIVYATLNGKTVKYRAQGKKQKRKRKKIYDTAVFEALKKLWYIFDCICGKRLVYMIRTMLISLMLEKEIVCTDIVRDKLLSISACQADRMLSSERKALQMHGMSHTRPGSMVKYQIPIRRSGEWQEATKPGYFAMDLVGHEGGNAHGDFACTLNMTDIYTGWTEPSALKNKAQKWTFEAIKHVRTRLPFEIVGLHSDSGAEFINNTLYRYCNAEHIIFTRSRPNHKNDNAHVEQKNNTVIRRFLGYSRYDTDEEVAVMNRLYERLRLYVNFFMPSSKLKSKERIGSRIKKRYEPYRTPYERLVSSGILSLEKQSILEKQKMGLNPAKLIREINSIQQQLMRIQNQKVAAAAKRAI
jgi:hypothetical protein